MFYSTEQTQNVKPLGANLPMMMAVYMANARTLPEGLSCCAGVAEAGVAEQLCHFNPDMKTSRRS
jgi:hypothetical protein